MVLRAGLGRERLWARSAGASTAGLVPAFPYPAATLDMSFTANAYRYGTNPAYLTLPDFLTAVGGTFTRASSGTYFDATGTLQTASSNVPRLDYNPATLAARGYLSEEARTNALIRSAEFDNAVWTKEASVSVSPNTTVAPDGTTSGDTVTANSSFAIYQTTVSVIGTIYCQSVFVKAGTATAIMFRDDSGAGRHIIFNPSTGVITGTSGTLVGSGTQTIGGGWFRLWFSYTADALTARGLLRPDSAGAGQTFIVWGAQTEVGSSPTSYIPTTTVAVARAADVLQFPTSGWFNAAAGTLFAIGVPAALNTAGGATRRLIEISDGTSANRSIIGVNPTPTGRAFVVSGGAPQADIALSSYTAGAQIKIAGVYANNDFQAAQGGTLGTQDVSGTVSAGITTATIGAESGGATNVAAWNGWIERFVYVASRLSDATLQSIST